MSDMTPRTSRYETVGAYETLSVELPDGIGVVHIRTHIRRGASRSINPVIAVEVVSDSLDTPAADGRVYEPELNPAQNTIYLVGYNPPKEG